MADKDDFDEIASHFEKSGNQGEHDAPETAWEAVQLFWPQIMGEGLPIKGVMIVEYIRQNGDRGFYLCTNEDAMEWEIKGLLSHATDLIKDEGTLNGVYHVVNAIMNEDEEDDDG